MENKFKTIQFSTYLDVKDPVNPVSDGNGVADAGFDVYMPEINEAFLIELVRLNKCLQVEGLDKWRGIRGTLPVSTIRGNWYDFDKNFLSNNLYELYYKTSPYKDIYSIRLFVPLNVPLGIKFLVPRYHYLDIRPKSSNFADGFEPVLGLIDNNHTRGICIQPNTINGSPVTLIPGHKVCQLVLKRFDDVSLVKVPGDEFDNLEEVYYRRKYRDGAFGSRGKE
jgi:dUTPase